MRGCRASPESLQAWPRLASSLIFSGDPPFIMTAMDLDAIVQDVDAEVSRLEKARALLTGHTAPPRRAVVKPSC